MKLVPIPLSFIGQFSRIIEQSAISVHHVVFPLTSIVASILVVEGALTVSFLSEYEASVYTTVLVCLLAILTSR